MVQQSPVSEFGDHMRGKRVRSKSESTSEHSMVSSFVFFSVSNEVSMRGLHHKKMLILFLFLDRTSSSCA